LRPSGVPPYGYFIYLLSYGSYMSHENYCKSKGQRPLKNNITEQKLFSRAKLMCIIFLTPNPDLLGVTSFTMLKNKYFAKNINYIVYFTQGYFYENFDNPTP